MPSFCSASGISRPNSCWKIDGVSPGAEQAVPTAIAGRVLGAGGTAESARVTGRRLMRRRRMQRH